LTVHSRRAEKEVIDTIGSNYPCKTILHWYSGSIKELERAIDFGFYFSVNMAMLKSENGKKIIQVIPDDKILTETDAPFITEIDSPLLIHKTVCKLEILKPTASKELIYQNFKKLISLT
jgi:TatD DNase family protein